MPAPSLRARHVRLSMALLGLAALASAGARADIYDDAVAHAGRPAADLKRDPIDHPAEILRLAGIKPGMRVGDFMAANGYYSELLSYLVGPTGHVLMINNAAYDYWSPEWPKRVAGNRLPNVEHMTLDLQHLNLPDHSLDAALLIKVYHDLYVYDPKDPVWPKMDPQKVLSEIARVLKPGGVLLLVDHSARPGSGTSDTYALHRIEEAYARSDFEKHGFVVVASSQVLRRPDDPRDQISYRGPMLGKTDRFVLVFRKQGVRRSALH
ncbi:MAG: methyltransferase domain-containing protein [Steroidobacteraceae bacterium]